MAKYLLLFHVSPGELSAMAPRRFQELIAAYMDWQTAGQAAGRVVQATKLADGAGRRVTGPGDEARIETRTFTDAGELLSGLVAVEAASYDEAASIAAACPHIAFGPIDVRQVEFG